VLIDIWLAKKFLFLSGPVGPRSDITPKSEFFVGLVNAREAKNASAKLQFWDLVPACNRVYTTEP
jgi:hypothetical protein